MNKDLFFGLLANPYNPEGKFPVSIVQDPDGTTRLAVSNGVPLLGQVTSFKYVNVDTIQPDGTVVYTTPGNKTFYVMGFIVTNTDGSNPHLFKYTLGGQIFTINVAAQDSVLVGNGQFPVAIVASANAPNNTIELTSNGGTTPYGVANFWGYELFGATT